MDLIFFALLMLSGFGATVFASAGAGWQGWLGLAVGFAATAFWTRQGHPLDPVWIGGLSALAAVAHLVVPGRGWLAAAVGGALAAIFHGEAHRAPPGAGGAQARPPVAPARVSRPCRHLPLGTGPYPVKFEHSRRRLRMAHFCLGA